MDKTNVSPQRNVARRQPNSLDITIIALIHGTNRLMTMTEVKSCVLLVGKFCEIFKTSREAISRRIIPITNTFENALDN